MSLMPNNVSPQIEEKIMELARLFAATGQIEIEEFTELFYRSSDSEESLPTGKYVLISVRTVDGSAKDRKQMSRPSVSNVQKCGCCGRPK